MAIYFTSDLHLGAHYHPNALDVERRAVKWLESLDDAEEVYLLGDILDYWYEYRNVVPRGFTRFLGQLARMSDRGVKITWLTGNHDIWIRDYIPSETGCEVYSHDITRNLIGKDFYLSHGDLMGNVPRRYRFLKSIFTNRLLQCLFSSIHPRWTVGLAHNWSRHSRKSGGQIPSHKIMNGVTEWAAKYQSSHAPVNFFITGHRHILVDEPLPDGARLIVLPDWNSQPTYARWDGKEIAICNVPAL